MGSLFENTGKGLPPVDVGPVAEGPVAGLAPVPTGAVGVGAVEPSPPNEIAATIATRTAAPDTPAINATGRRLFSPGGTSAGPAGPGGPGGTSAVAPGIAVSAPSGIGAVDAVPVAAPSQWAEGGERARRRGRRRRSDRRRGRRRRLPRRRGCPDGQPEPIHHRDARGVPIMLGLGHAPADHAIDLGRHTRTSLGDRGGRVLKMSEQRRDIGSLLEWRGRRQALVHDARQRVFVRPTVHLVALDLLGGDVVHRAHEGPGLGQPALGRRGLRQAEVRQVGMLLVLVERDQDVGRLDVAVDESRPMGCVQGARDRMQQRPDALGLESPLSLDQAAQVCAAHVPHRDEQIAVDLAGLVDGHDVRVVEPGRELRLADEPAPERRVGRELRGQHLDRDAACEARVFGQVDDAHPAPAQLGLDAIPAEGCTLAKAHAHARVLSDCRTGRDLVPVSSVPDGRPRRSWRAAAGHGSPRRAGRRPERPR